MMDNVEIRESAARQHQNMARDARKFVCKIFKNRVIKGSYSGMLKSKPKGESDIYFNVKASIIAKTFNIGDSLFVIS